MKLFNTKFFMICLLMAGTTSSCLEKQEEEFGIVGAVPTVLFLNKPEKEPIKVKIRGAIDIQYRYFSPNVAVNRIAIMERITSETGTEKHTGEILNQSVTNFNTADSYENSFTYTANNSVLEVGDVVTFTIEAFATNGLSNSEAISITISDSESTE